MRTWTVARTLALPAAVLALLAAGPARHATAQGQDLVAQAQQALAANKVDDALALLQRAIAAAPNDPAALSTLGSAQVRKAATASPLEAFGWVTKGFDTLDAAVARFPTSFVVYATRGMTAAAVPEMFNKAPVAVKDLTAVIAMKEKDPAAVPDAVMPGVYLNLGLAHKKAGALAEARVTWEKGRTLYPNAAEAAAMEKEIKSLGQAPPARFPNVIEALKASPGCLGVETAQTAGGKRVIFAWFDGKKSLVDWYYSDAHQRAMKAVFPEQTFDRTPLPDLADDSGPVLAIVSVKFADGATPDTAPRRIASIGIELYGPLPGGIAVGARFAPDAIKVRGLREIDLTTARPAATGGTR